MGSQLALVVLQLWAKSTPISHSARSSCHLVHSTAIKCGAICWTYLFTFLPMGLGVHLSLTAAENDERKKYAKGKFCQALCVLPR